MRTTLRKRGHRAIALCALALFCLAVAVPVFSQATKPATIRLAWWGGETRHKATVAAAEAFMKKYPNITVKTEYSGFEGYYDKLITQLAAGTGPDAFQFIIAWFGDFQKSPEMFADLRKVPNLDLSGWTSTSLEYGTLGTKLIGLPLGANGRILVYNKTLADQLGLKVDKYFTWRTFADAIKAARAKDPSVAGYSGTMDQYGYPLIAYLVQKTGKPYISKNAEFGFTEKDLAEGLALFKSWFADGTFLPLEKTVLLKNSWSDPDWLGGKVLFSETPVTQVPQHLNYKYKVDFTRYWMLEGAKLSGVEVGPNMMFCMNAKTKEPEAVTLLLNFLYTDPEGAKLMATERGVPTNKKGYDVLVKNNMIDSVTKTAMQLIDDTDTGKFSYFDPVEVRALLHAAIQQVALKSNNASPEAAAKEFYEKATKVLKNFK
ncbi:MAG: ABC transporter substrate-binding protein [Spirochaetes bacterium]|nr:ABC transporter substrate-binding protein [Spirochaetota bacterium]